MGIAGRIGLLSGLLLIASASRSQVGITAGADGNGERLVQKRLELTADVTGHFAKVKTAHIFRSSEYWQSELDIIYTLPDGAIPTDFAYYYRGERVPAFITEKERAKQIYKNITTRQQDPALIEFISKKTFRVRIFPVEVGQDLRMEVSWIQIAKTVKGVPTFEFPMKMRKQDPLSEVSAKVNFAPVSWLKRAAENIGLKSSSGVFSFEGKAVRPRKDWRFALIPREGQSPVTIVSGRSGSDKGYAVIAGNSGQALNSPMTMSVGGTKVSSGTYGSTSALSQEVSPNHVGMKVWAYQRLRSLERSSKNREQIIALSLRHNLISKFTSWIAIPTEERKRFAQMIKEAKTAIKAQEFADKVAKGVLGEKEVRRQYQALSKEIQEVAEFPDEFERENLFERLSAPLNERIYQLGRFSKRTLLALERDYVATRTRIGWLGQKDPGAWLSQVPGYPEYLQAKLIGGPYRGSLDWEFIAKKCPNLYQQSTRDGTATGFDGAVDELLTQVCNTGISDKTRRAMDRISKFQREHRFKKSIDYFINFRTGQWVESKSEYEPASEAKLAELAYVIGRIGVGTEQEFRRLPDLQKMQEECQLLSSRWFQAKRINREDLDALKAKLDKLPRRLAETCVKNSLVYPFSARSECMMPSPVEFKDRAEYLKNYRAKLEEYAEVIPEIKPTFEQSERDANFYLDSLVIEARWSYINAVEQSDSSAVERADAKERYLKTMKWAYQDGDRAEREFASLTLGTREQLLETYRKRDEATADDRRKAEEAFRKDPNNESFRGSDYVKDRIRRLQLNVEIRGLEDTGASPSEIASLKEELEPIVARMGDPLLSLELSSDTVAASAIFPWGETRAMTLDPKSGEFQVRFDIPPTAKEGANQIIVVSYTSLGVPTVRFAPLRVDMTAPSLTISEVGGRLVIRDLSKQVVRVKAFGASGEIVPLVTHGSFEWTSEAPVEDASNIRVFAFDGAHNVARYLGGEVLEVKPVEAQALTLSATPIQELSGKNIQAVGHWRGIDFAGTLDEGLYFRRPGGDWTLMGGLPSQAARQFVPFGNELAIRFGSGDLVLLNESFEVKALNHLLPRHSALAIASDGVTLAVAQTGGFSVIGAETSHWFDLPELAGGAPSAITLEGDLVRIAIQGRGFFSVNLSSRGITAMAEPQGLTDDWVTGFGNGVVGTFGGGAYTFGDGKLAAILETSGMQVTGISGNLIATRTGVFMLHDGSVRELDLGGRDEVQGVCKTDQGTLLATRNGVLRIAQ